MASLAPEVAAFPFAFAVDLTAAEDIEETGVRDLLETATQQEWG